MSITRRSFLGALSGFVSFGCQAVCPNPDETFDLIVVGSGVAGLTTAVIAAESGIRRVVVLEKQPLLGGTGVFLKQFFRKMPALLTAMIRFTKTC